MSMKESLKAALLNAATVEVKVFEPSEAEFKLIGELFPKNVSRKSGRDHVDLPEVEGGKTKLFVPFGMKDKIQSVMSWIYREAKGDEDIKLVLDSLTAGTGRWMIVERKEKASATPKAPGAKSALAD